MTILKSGVTQQGVRSPVFFACGVTEMIYRHRGYTCVITSLTDSHADRPKSLHNAGLAVDFRTKNVPRDLWPSLTDEISSVLNPMGFDVVLEADHIHVEYQPKTGENWQKLEFA